MNLLVERHPQVLGVRDNDGNIPLFLACGDRESLDSVAADGEEDRTSDNEGDEAAEADAAQVTFVFELFRASVERSIVGL